MSEPVIFCGLLGFAVILCADKRYSSAVLCGINLWAATVLPALFPYFFITAILSALNFTSKIANAASPLTKRLFNTGGLVGYAFLMSVISGYPVGAKIVADLKGNGLLTDAESTRAAAFCSTPSPMFLIGCVGNIMFDDFKFGLFLFATCFLSACIVGIIFSFYKRNEKPATVPLPQNKNADNLLYESVYSAVISVLTVGGLITIFYILTEVLLSLRILSPLCKLVSLIFGDENIGTGIITGIFECTKGIKKISESGINFFTLPITAAICGFGGLSVIAQSTAYLKKAKIKTAAFIYAKLLTAVICFILGMLFSVFL